MGHSRHQSGDEDGEDGERADVSDEEPEDTEDPGIAAEGASVGEFVIDIRLLESPADEEDCEQAAESHKDVGREIIKEVEDGVSGNLQV